MQPHDEHELYQFILEHFNQNEPLTAVKELDTLLGHYARVGQVPKILATLEALINEYPRVPELRSRLAALYQKLGRTEQAIEQLDVLGEIQLETGEAQAAKNTIQQIMTLLNQLNR